jgi:transposase
MRLQSDRAKAERLFVREGKSLARVAAEMGIGLTTIKQWSKDGNWSDHRRACRRETPNPALDVLKRQLELQVAKIGDDKLAAPEVIDALHKLSVSIEKMESRLEPIGPMLDAIGRFARFVAARADDQACELVRTWVEKFFQEERRRSN